MCKSRESAVIKTVAPARGPSPTSRRSVVARPSGERPHAARRTSACRSGSITVARTASTRAEASSGTAGGADRTGTSQASARTSGSRSNASRVVELSCAEEPPGSESSRPRWRSGGGRPGVASRFASGWLGIASGWWTVRACRCVVRGWRAAASISRNAAAGRIGVLVAAGGMATCRPWHALVRMSFHRPPGPVVVSFVEGAQP